MLQKFRVHLVRKEHHEACGYEEAAVAQQLTGAGHEMGADAGVHSGLFIDEQMQHRLIWLN